MAVMRPFIKVRSLSLQAFVPLGWTPNSGMPHYFSGKKIHIAGLVQGYSKPNALAMESLQYHTKPSKLGHATQVAITGTTIIMPFFKPSQNNMF